MAASLLFFIERVNQMSATAFQRMRREQAAKAKAEKEVAKADKSKKTEKAKGSK